MTTYNKNELYVYAASCAGISTVYSVAAPSTVTLAVEKLGSVSGNGAFSNLKLRSTAAADSPVKVIVPPFGNPNG